MQKKTDGYGYHHTHTHILQKLDNTPNLDKQNTKKHARTKQETTMLWDMTWLMEIVVEHMTAIDRMAQTRLWRLYAWLPPPESWVLFPWFFWSPFFFWKVAKNEFYRTSTKPTWKKSHFWKLFFRKTGQKKKAKNDGNHHTCQLFLADVQGNLENVSGAMWRYFFCTSKNGKKTSKMKGNNTYANFFLANFQWKLENVRGAMWRYFFVHWNTVKKNVKNEGKQYICQLFLANFQKNLENVRGAMWRYFFVPRKTAKKRQTWKETIHMPTFFGPIFKETWKTFVALCGAMWHYFAYLEKRLKNVKNERK